MVTNTRKKKTKKKVTKKATKKAPVKKEKPEGYVFGRPTKYKKEFCQTVVDEMAKGLSKTAVAGVLKIDRDTLLQWTKDHADFSGAIKQGEILSQLWWEKKAIETITHTKGSKQLNSTSWIFNMKNRFNWRDKKEIALEDETKKTFGFTLDKKPEEID